jgi:MFS family permease
VVATRDPRTYALSPFGRLVVTQALSMVGDACVTVSLAGSIFFTQDVAGSRSQVLLYLVLTLAPFAVVAPVIGPALDRSRAGRRGLLAAGCALRALVCLLLAPRLASLALYPLAFGALVLAKGHSVAKSALVPALVADEARLVEANSRLSLVSVIAGVAGGLPAAGVVASVGAPWALRLGAVVFAVATLTALRIPAARVVAEAESPAERRELAVASIVFAGTAMGVLRFAVGFVTFLTAFLLKKGGQPTWFYGSVLAVSAAGGFVGVVVAPRLRERLREETILAASLLTPAAVALLAARYGGRTGYLLVAAAVAVGAASGRIAFDSLLQRDGPEHLRGRAFARFETRFQLIWVAGALVPVLLLEALTARRGFFALCVILGFAGLSYLAGLRARGEWRPRR